MTKTSEDAFISTSVMYSSSMTQVVKEALAASQRPGLVVLIGAPGGGRSTALNRVIDAVKGPVFHGGGLAMMATVPAFALARALKTRLPTHDVSLLAEAVRSRVRGGLLALDDLQWADPLTIHVLPLVAPRCRIVVTVRNPHRLSGAAEESLRTAATAWLTIPPLSVDEAVAITSHVAPHASASLVAEIVRRAGGIPLALHLLIRHMAWTNSSHRTGSDHDEITVAYTIAVALADLTRPARTVLACLGLLGRPADLTLVGDGVAELVDVGLARIDGDVVCAVSPYTADIAAGLLDPQERRILHRRLAELVPVRESIRHWAAAGASHQAYQAAVTAAAAESSPGERAEFLVMACQLDEVTPDDQVRLAAARAALAVGHAQACVRVLGTHPGGQAAVMRGEAYYQSGDVDSAVAAVGMIGDEEPADVLAGRDRILLLADLARGPGHAAARLATVVASHGERPSHTGLQAAIAAVRASMRTPRWERGLALAATAAGESGDGLSARWSAWLLAETLAGDGRVAEAMSVAQAAAAACATDMAYSWQTRFLAVGLWCAALRGGDIDDVIRRAVDLIDQTLPDAARGYALAAVGLAEADSGLLASARARVAGPVVTTPMAKAMVAWVEWESAWLDGQPDRDEYGPQLSGNPLIEGLWHVTAHWAAYDAGRQLCQTWGERRSDLSVVYDTLDAWSHPDTFVEVSRAWRDLSRREEVRCLLAYGLLTQEPGLAVPCLLEAERLARESGLVVLLGRVQRALRRHAVRRDIRGRWAGDDLTDRERQILRLVSQGEPTRRIAGMLGISRETVETHIRSGMRKLGARTRTEAAALAIEVLQ